MIITIKTLQQKSFKVEIDETENVAALKQKIEKEQGPSFPAAGLKLIYAGKILSDASPVSEYKIQENNFVVVMVSKVKNQPPPKPPIATALTAPQTTTSGQTSATPQETSTSESAQPQAQAESLLGNPPEVGITAPTSAETVPMATSSVSEPAETETETTDRGGSEASGDSWQQVSSMLATGSEYDQAIANLMEMGYERDQVVQAMQASFNNPNTAAEYLISGIPEHVYDAQPPPSSERVQSRAPEPPSDPSPQAPPISVPSGGVVSPSGGVVSPSSSAEQQVNPSDSAVQGESEQENPLEFLRQQPQFDTLRSTLQRNPGMLQALLQQIGQSNPQLLQVISQNQQAFIRLLNSGGSDAAAPQSAGGQESNIGPSVPPGGAGAQGFGTPISIQVTPEEKEAIDRLKAMGFPEHLVIQAFFACEKNENLTMEFLLNQDPNDD